MAASIEVHVLLRLRPYPHEGAPALVNVRLIVQACMFCSNLCHVALHAMYQLFMKQGMFALLDRQNCRIGRPYRDVQDRLLWKDKTCSAHT